MLSTFRHLLRKFSNIQGRIYLNGKHIYGSSEERIQAFIIIPWRPRLSFRLGWTVFKPCLFPLRYKSKSCSGYCWSFEELESARSIYRCPEWKVQTNVKLAAPGTTKQNSSKFKLSEQIWSTEIATRGSLSLGGVRNENVDPEELRSPEVICRSLIGCEGFQADTVMHQSK